MMKKIIKCLMFCFAFISVIFLVSCRRIYKITWQNADGTVLKVDKVLADALPEYKGDIPTKEKDAENTYTFSGWSPEVVAATADTTYKAVFTPTTNKYKITWKNEDASIIKTEEVLYGVTPTYTGDEPVKASDDSHTYKFSGWSPEITPVSKDAEYIATFNATNIFTVTWKNADGSVIKTEKINEGIIPSYTGDEPVKASDDSHTYKFSGWSPEITPISKDTEYIATFTTTDIFTITWKNVDGSVLKVDKVLAGATPEYKGDTPTKERDAENTYTFSGWSPNVVASTENTTYTAVFTSTTNKYKITWKNADGSVIKSEEVLYGTTPTYSGDEPVKASDDAHSYKFNGWSPDITPVNKDTEYIATFNAIDSYTIIWKNYDGTELKKSENVKHGTIPTYDGDIPTKPDTDDKSFLFYSWDPAIIKAERNAEYNAKYLEYPKNSTHLILWKNYDNTLISISSVDSYENIKFEGTLPTKPNDSQGSYTFKEWVLSDNSYNLAIDHKEYIASYVKKGFETYDEKYVSEYSILTCTNEISANQENPTFEFNYVNFTFVEDINASFINLYGSFSNLLITNVKNEKNKLTIETKGTVGEYDNGVIAFAKESNSKGVLITYEITPEGIKSKIDIINASFDATISYIKGTQDSETNFTHTGNFEIKLNGCSFSKIFQDNIASILSIEDKLLEIFKFDEDSPSVYNVSITSISDYELKGQYVLSTLQELKMNNTKIIFNDSIKDKNGKEYKIFAKKDDPNSVINLVLSKEIRPDWDLKDLIDSKIINNEKYIVSQTASQKFEDVKSTIVEYAFNNKEDNNAVMNTLNKVVQIISIGVGVYKGDFFNTKNSILSLFGLDSKEEEILNKLKDIEKELNNIENQITIIRDELETIKQELIAIQEEALLNNYLNAYKTWNEFINQYYLTLANNIYAYNTFYYQYYYDFAIKTFNKLKDTDIKINIYYDVNGEQIIPNSNASFGIYGEQIDFSKNKEVSIYELTSTIAGIQKNGGHAYPNIESDIIVDLKYNSNLDDKTILEVLKALRFNAMTYYFTEEDRLISFINSFTNFCKILTGTQMGATSSTNTKPLDAYVIMLSTVYNFGFETEADINLVLIKLSTLFLSASKIMDIANYVNPGEVAFVGYEKMFNLVKDELSSTRFYHKNKSVIDGSSYTNEVYLYAVNDYVNFFTKTYAIFYFWTNGTGKECVNITENTPDKMYGNTFKSLSSISANAVQTMALKIKLYNKLNGTNYSFGEYLVHIGILSKDELDNMEGVIYEITGIKNNIADYTYNRDHMTLYHQGTGDGSPVNFDAYTGGFSINLVLAGGSYSFKKEAKYTGLLGMKQNIRDMEYVDVAVVTNLKTDFDITGWPFEYGAGRPSFKISTSATWILFSLASSTNS